MNQLVSVIAPAYKHEKYIETCIKSIAGQTYANKELVIIDDNSPDRTANLIERVISDNDIKKHFTRIKFILHTVNMGAHYSINEGIQEALGEYITVINTDDLFEPNRLEEMVNALNINKKYLAFSGVDTIDEDSKVLRNDEWEYYNTLQKKIEQYPLVCMALLTDNVAISTGNMFFSKDLFYRVGAFKNYQYIHDWDFILRATLIEEPIFVNTTKYLYRLHGENSFKALKEDQDLCARESWAVLTNYCKAIKKKNYSNTIIPSVEVWEYFINEVICNPDIAHIWINS